MEDDRRLQAAGALVAIIGLVLLVIQYAGSRPAPKTGGGPGWYSRVNPFGSQPDPGPAPAYEAPAPELPPPERVMTNAATRQFSSPTAAVSAGGLAGAESPAPSAPPYSTMNASRLVNASVDIPGGGRAPSAGGMIPRSAPPPAGGGGRAPSSPRSAAPPSVGSAARSAGAPGAASASPGGETAAAAAGASSFSSAAGASASAGSIPGAPRLGAMDANGVSSMKSEALKETPSLSAASSSGGGGGPGDLGGGGGGGGGGSGGSGGMGGAVPGGKPKESAGKPSPSDSVGGKPVAGGSTGGSTGGSSGVSQGGSEESGPSARAGIPDVGEGTPSGRKFSLKPGGPAVIETRIFLTKKNVPLVGFTAKMAIDGDGPGGEKDGDPHYQPETALKSNGVSLNARVVPFIVIPGDFSAAHPNVKLGDYAAVTYGGKTSYAIVGDIGPKGVLGEGSPALARSVGINPNPVSGGVQSATVRYLIMPGTRKSTVPGSAAEIQTQVGSAFESAGAELR